ncbi:17067_t:CDS:10 [Acaulospora morrowiae]|uniref:17067_t:CDS:1 n=1 Tax=Acaulospora morrowiae TaxID=94023 RepID=A0A9N8VX30_9GLOM|nr:17067_t:CDS:10 [Acaulospora morrowiae]
MDPSQVPNLYKQQRGPPKIKNKTPAPIQITAEQILREAKERQEAARKEPRQKISDLEELSEYRLRKRKEFEDSIRRNRLNIGSWLKYATWEESQKELNRARSVYERALDVDSRNVTLYIKYTEMEMKNRNVNHARNLFDRAVTLLPRVDQFWYKYTYMEEMLGNIAGARQIFERWMQWEPDESAWNAYIKMERRYNEIDRARAIYERFVNVHPEPKNWLKWVKFEEEQHNLEKCREIYSQAIGALGDDHIDQKIFISFAKFETKLKEFERARILYKYALEKLPRLKSEALYNAYTQFEKQYGDKEGIEDVVIGKRRVQYDEELKSNPKNYDIWFDYARLEENVGDTMKVREIYERAISQDYERTRQIYQECLKIIPHKKFTFAKIWLLYAQFEVRQLDLTTARKTLGNAIGLCPKDRLFKGYIELELQLREFDRCRILYTKYLEHNPANCYAWIKFAELERMLGDYDRCRAIFELAVDQPILDMPELLWKAYIDFEFSEEEYEKTRQLYRRLLDKTGHVKVWISYAQFELNADVENREAAVERSRKVFETAYKSMKEKGLKEERVLLLESWKDFESNNGTQKTLSIVESKLPKVVKKRRKLDEAEGQAGVAWEEYYDYIFPDDQAQQPNFKLLERAYAWRQQQLQQKNDEESEQVDQQTQNKSETPSSPEISSTQPKESPRSSSGPNSPDSANLLKSP